jgi:hypothetical protein
MQVEVEIGFEQLVKLAKQLPVKQWTKLKQEVDNMQPGTDKPADLESFLLNAPTFSKKQLDAVKKTRKAINQWRTK